MDDNRLFFMIFRNHRFSFPGPVILDIDSPNPENARLPNGV